MRRESKECQLALPPTKGEVYRHAMGPILDGATRHGVVTYYEGRGDCGFRLDRFWIERGTHLR